MAGRRRTIILPSFILKLFIASAIGNAYGFIHLLRVFRPGKWLFAAVPWFLLMALGPVISWYLDFSGPVHLFLSWAQGLWTSLGAVVLILFLLHDFLRLIVWAIRRGSGKPSKLTLYQRIQISKKVTVAALVLSFVVCAYSVYEAHTLKAVHFTFRTKKIPPGKRVRIVYASDMHIISWTGAGMLERQVKLIAAQAPDVILLGGDILDAPLKGREKAIALLASLKAPYGKFAVFGNHEPRYGVAEAAEFYNRSGFKLLRRQAVETAGLTIIGVDDPVVSAAEKTKNHSPMELLKKNDRSRYTILLDHRPVLRPSSVGLFDLQLSGHSHGGQIWPMRHIVEWIYGTPTGLSFHQGKNGESALFVTTGTGFSRVPMRLFTPPEIVVIDLVNN